MARPIEHQVRAPQVGADARDELDRLLEACHEHGVLRLATDLVAANADVARVLTQGLQKEGVLNAIQNLSILAMALSRIPPSDFYRCVFALRDGLTTLTSQADREDGEAPGLSGAYRALKDDELWRIVTPFLRALEATALSLRQPVDHPISAFSGKERRDQ